MDGKGALTLAADFFFFIQMLFELESAFCNSLPIGYKKVICFVLLWTWNPLVSFPGPPDLHLWEMGAAPDGQHLGVCPVLQDGRSVCDSHFPHHCQVLRAKFFLQNMFKISKH